MCENGILWLKAKESSAELRDFPDGEGSLHKAFEHADLPCPCLMIKKKVFPMDDKGIWTPG